MFEGSASPEIIPEVTEQVSVIPNEITTAANVPLVVDTTKKVIAETRSETFSHEPKSQLEERKNVQSLEIKIKESPVVPSKVSSEVQSPVIDLLKIVKSP